MSERQAGWYWVKAYSDAPWECARWNGRAWANASINHEHHQIGPRIPSPDEGWQCVPVDLTPPMRRAGQHALEHGCYIDGIYADIIAAAPKPEDT